MARTSPLKQSSHPKITRWRHPLYWINPLRFTSTSTAMEWSWPSYVTWYIFMQFEKACSEEAQLAQVTLSSICTWKTAMRAILRKNLPFAILVVNNRKEAGSYKRQCADDDVSNAKKAVLAAHPAGRTQHKVLFTMRHREVCKAAKLRASQYWREKSRSLWRDKAVHWLLSIYCNFTHFWCSLIFRYFRWSKFYRN